MKDQHFKRLAGYIQVAVVVGLCASRAIADGSFYQLDVSSETTTAVFSIERGDFTFGATAVDYVGGQTAVVSVIYRFPDSPDLFALRLGPAFGWTQDENEDPSSEVGVRLSADRYIGTEFGNLYFLADLNSINEAGFVLAQMGLTDPEVSFEFSHGRGETYEETTLAFFRQMQNSAVSLRVGYRFDASEVFAGISINTF